jgi:hypothetical protein
VSLRLAFAALLENETEFSITPGVKAFSSRQITYSEGLNQFCSNNIFDDNFKHDRFVVILYKIIDTRIVLSQTLSRSLRSSTLDQISLPTSVEVSPLTVTHTVTPPAPFWDRSSTAQAPLSDAWQ